MILLSGTIHNVKVWTIILAGAHHTTTTTTIVAYLLCLYLRSLSYIDSDILPKKKVRNPRKGKGDRDSPGASIRPVFLLAEMSRKIEHWGNILLIVCLILSLSHSASPPVMIYGEKIVLRSISHFTSLHFSSLRNFEKYNFCSLASQSQSMKMIINDSQNPNPWIWK